MGGGEIRRMNVKVMGARVGCGWSETARRIYSLTNGGTSMYTIYDISKYIYLGYDMVMTGIYWSDFYTRYILYIYCLQFI